MTCTCPALTARCPHCGSIAGPAHRDACHDAAADGADVIGWYGWYFAQMNRRGLRVTEATEEER